MSFLQPFLSSSPSSSHTPSARAHVAPELADFSELQRSPYARPAPMAANTPRGVFAAARISARSPVGAWIFGLRRPVGAPVTKLPKGVR
jgi:hypothetical protein